MLQFPCQTTSWQCALWAENNTQLIHVAFSWDKNRSFCLNRQPKSDKVNISFPENGTFERQ